MRRSNRPSRGFTLIEVVVVILVIGMTLVAALSDLTRPPRLELSETAGSVLALVESARSAAALTGSPRTLVYDLDARPQRVWIEIPPPSDDPSRDPEKTLETPLPDRVVLAVIQTGKDTRHETGVVRLAAQPGGFLPAHLVRLTASGGSLEKTGVVRAFPGASRLVDGAPEWDDLLREIAEEDVAGVKAIPPEDQ